MVTAMDAVGVDGTTDTAGVATRLATAFYLTEPDDKKPRKQGCLPWRTRRALPACWTHALGFLQILGSAGR
jgi:hypothetical protein